MWKIQSFWGGLWDDSINGRNTWCSGEVFWFIMKMQLFWRGANIFIQLGTAILMLAWQRRSYICNIFPLLQTSGLINNFHQLNQNFIHKPGKFFCGEKAPMKTKWNGEGKVSFLNIFSIWWFLYEVSLFCEGCEIFHCCLNECF